MLESGASKRLKVRSQRCPQVREWGDTETSQLSRQAVSLLEGSGAGSSGGEYGRKSCEVGLEVEEASQGIKGLGHGMPFSTAQDLVLRGPPSPCETNNSLLGMGRISSVSPLSITGSSTYLLPPFGDRNPPAAVPRVLAGMVSPHCCVSESCPDEGGPDFPGPTSPSTPPAPGSPRAPQLSPGTVPPPIPLWSELKNSASCSLSPQCFFPHPSPTGSHLSGSTGSPSCKHPREH